jgi:hypothetical protein
VILPYADYLLQAIDWINSQKVNNAAGLREQNIVMGISMGGLVSRYALAKRTKQTGTNSTEAKELITMDSPHQGANVPLGLQHFLYDFGEAKIVKKIGDVSDDLKAFYNLNNFTSTQQQLILRVTDGNGGRANNTFLAEGGPYRTMVDYNAPYPFYAVSNGSQCAVPVMQPGTLLLKKEGNVATANWLLFFWKNKYRLNIQVNALPAYGSQSQVCSVVMERNIRLFWGAIGTGWKTTSNTAPRLSPANTIPWDGVPGGTKSTETTGPISQTGTTPAINQSNTFLGNVWRSILYAFVINVHTNIQLPFSQKEFSFVPITSALDVENVTANTFTQPFNFAVNGLTGSRANKFISQDFAASNLYNIEHTNFTPRNSRWIYNEMENITQPPLNCNDICTNSIQIIGADNFCTTSTYNVPYLPSYASVTWSSSNTNVATVTQSGNTAIVTHVTNGSFILTAAINFNGGNNCGIPTTLTKEIYTGVPGFGANYNNGIGTFNPLLIFIPGQQGNPNYYNDVCIGYGFPNTYVDAFPYGTNNVVWSVPNGYATADFSLIQQTGNRAYFKWNFGGITQPGYLQATVSNSCGSFSQIFAFKQKNCNPTGGDPCQTARNTNYLTVSPNPASNIITIGIGNKPAPIECNGLKALHSPNGITFSIIKIYNSLGILVKSYENRNVKTATINVGNLIGGFYRIEIITGDYVEKQQFIIQK